MEKELRLQWVWRVGKDRLVYQICSPSGPSMNGAVPLGGACPLTLFFFRLPPLLAIRNSERVVCHASASCSPRLLQRMREIFHGKRILVTKRMYYSSRPIIMQVVGGL